MDYRYDADYQSGKLKFFKKNCIIPNHFLYKEVLLKIHPGKKNHIKTNSMNTKNIIILSLALAFISCQKDPSQESLVVERTKLLTAKEWVLQKAEEREGNSNWKDVFPQFLPCLRDNRFKFNTDFTVVYSEGPVACTPNSPNQVLETQKWKLNIDGTVLITGNVENKILQLDGEKLVVLISETVAGITYETKNTFGR